LTLVVLSPITSLVLNQYDFNFLPWRQPVFVNGIMLGFIVAIGRLIVSISVQTQVGNRLIQKILQGGKTHPSVESKNDTKPQKGTYGILIVTLIVSIILAVLGLLGIMHKGAAFGLILMLLFVWLSYGISVPKRRGEPNVW